METQIDKGELVLYQPDDASTQLDVLIDEETVWLTQAQMVELFNSTQQNISLHIHSIYKEGELALTSTHKDYLYVRREGGRKVKRRVSIYNLDVIISVGYRVKSKRGTRLRIWLWNHYILNPKGNHSSVFLHFVCFSASIL